MSEILFRGKRLDNGKWAEGYAAIKPSGMALIFEKPEKPVPDILIGCEVDAETISQNTGLTDRNGRKIFEGDIVREVIAGFAGIVRFGEHGKEYGYYIEWTSERAEYYRQDLLYWVRETGLEVLGNVFDDPSLQEGEKRNGKMQ